MAHDSKNPSSIVPDRYAVGTWCICCGICTVFAPALLAVDLERETGYIRRQPVTEDDERAVKKAMNNCPVHAINIQGGLP